jgi:hypothetical protein
MNRHASPFGGLDSACPSLNVLVPTSGRSVALLVKSLVLDLDSTR